MSEQYKLNADLNFVEGVLHHGGGDLKKCYQCSTCTVACPLTPDELPFPRKEMLEAQWGLRDRLVKNMDLWLCHNCNDCTDQCPRGAKPGDVMAALRSQTIEYYASSQAVARAAKTWAGNLKLFLFPVVLLAVLIYMLNSANGFAFLDAKPIVYANMFPVAAIDTVFLLAAAFAFYNIVVSLRQFISGLREHYPPREDGESLVQAMKGALKDILTHVDFKKCGPNQSRNLSHLLMMYGFIGLFITTNLVLVIHYLHEFGVDIQDTPFPFFHPVKLLGNISALAAFAGVFLIVRDRMRETNSVLTLFDWIFIVNMLLTVFSGIMSQVLRVADLAGAAFFTYYLHLIFVFYLLAYAPQTKFGHIFYRPAALVYARYAGRTRELGWDESSEPLKAAA